MKKANFKGSCGWVKSKGVTPALWSALLQRHGHWMQRLNVCECGTALLYPQTKVAGRCCWTNFLLLRHSLVLDCSPSLLCHLPAKLSTAVIKLVNKLRVSVFSTYECHFPKQDLIWVSHVTKLLMRIPVCLIISLQGQVHKYVNDQGKKFTV